MSFEGDGYLELSGNLLMGGADNDQRQQIAIQFTTNSSDGLLFWYGQEANINGGDRDFLSMASKFKTNNISNHLSSSDWIRA